MTSTQSPSSVIDAAQAFVSRRSAVTSACELPFNDAIHLYSHLNYLFRTGASARRANDTTALNLYWIDDAGAGFDGSWQGFSDLESAWTSEHDKALAALKQEFDTSNLSVGRPWKKLFMARFPITDIEVATSIVRTLDGALRDKGLGKVEVAVIHLDQVDEPDHLHVVFKWTGRKPRGKARLTALGF